MHALCISSPIDIVVLDGGNAVILLLLTQIPFIAGVGYCAVTTIFLISIYYNVINAWSFYYLFASMTSHLVWQNCNNTWNSPGE